MKKWLTQKLKNIDIKDVIIFLIPFVVFMIYWVVFYPGALSFDSYNQLEQIRNMKFSTSHPFFHTFIEMILMKIWNSPAIIGLFQISVFSILWTRICKYNRIKFDKRNNKYDLSFIFQIFISIFIVINPLNGVMSITLWKDVLYSYMILWLCFRLEILIDKKFKINLKDTILLSFLVVVLYNLRHNGIIITIGITFILFIVLFIKDRKSFNYLKLLAFVLLFFLGFKCLGTFYSASESQIPNSGEAVIDNKLFTMTSYILREGNILDEEIEELSEYINVDNLKRHGRYNLMDAIGGACEPKYDNINENRKEFYSFMYNLALKNKYIAFKYFLDENAYIWRIVRYDDSYGYLLKYTSGARNAGEYYYPQKFYNTKFYNIFKTNIDYSIKNENKFYQTLYYSGSLYLYISIACLIGLRVFKKIYLLVLSPLVLNLIGLMLSMPVNDVRYYYSNFMIGYLMLIIFGKYMLMEEKEEKIEHTFVILAYKESKYLEKCVKSIMNQSLKTNVVIATSTPNKYISDIAKKYNLEVIINKDENSNIGKDFDFALHSIKSELITIAHQDDIYDNLYAECVIKKYAKNKDKALIISTNYYEIKNNKTVKTNKLLTIKRVLIFPLNLKFLSSFKFVKRGVLSFGNSICCPSVTFVQNKMPKKLFESEFKCNVDWNAWETLSLKKGSFVYANKKLMGHRVHSESTTTKIIEENIRTKEDYIMFNRFWPKRISAFLNKFYSKAEDSNKSK